MKRSRWEQDQVVYMKNYTARQCYAGPAGPEQRIQKMMASGLIERAVTYKTLSLHFPPCGQIPPPIIMVQNMSFKYTNRPCAYNNLEFGIDLAHKWLSSLEYLMNCYPEIKEKKKKNKRDHWAICSHLEIAGEPDPEPA